MNSTMFKLNLKDVGHSAINAVIAAIVIGLAGVVSKSGFDIFNTDWTPIIHQTINWAFAAFIGSIGKTFVSDDDGKVFGKIAGK